MFSYENSRYRVYEFTERQDAIDFCAMFAGRFPFSFAAPIDRYIVLV